MSTNPVRQVVFSSQSGTPADFSEMLSAFSAGRLYVGKGGYSQSETETRFNTLANKNSELSENLTLLCDLAEAPGKTDSQVETLKTASRILEGKRNNLVELNLIGVDAKRKDWLENELNKEDLTFILESSDRNSILIFNRLRWICNWTFEFDGLFTSTIKTEYLGPSADGFLIFKY